MNEQQHDSAIVGRVAALAIRTARHGPMREADRVELRVGGGVEGDLPASPHRGVTLLAAGQWRQTCAELGADLPWHTRRANVLVEAEQLGPWIGRTVRVGGVNLLIEGETKPCGLMDELHPGLRAALEIEARGGVHGRVVIGGTVRVGDAVTLVK